MIVQAAPREHFGWIAERAEIGIGPGTRALEAVRPDGSIAGMVAFDGWMPGAVCLHVAVDSPMALRRLIAPAFGVAFDGFKRRVVLAMVVASNEESLRLVKGLGFREVFRGKDWFAPGQDLVFHEMRRDECRWLEA